MRNLGGEKTERKLFALSLRDSEGFPRRRKWGNLHMKDPSPVQTDITTADMESWMAIGQFALSLSAGVNG